MDGKVTRHYQPPAQSPGAELPSEMPLILSDVVGTRGSGYRGRRGVSIPHHGAGRDFTPGRATPSRISVALPPMSPDEHWSQYDEVADSEGEGLNELDEPDASRSSRSSSHSRRHPKPPLSVPTPTTFSTDAPQRPQQPRLRGRPRGSKMGLFPAWSGADAPRKPRHSSRGVANYSIVKRRGRPPKPQSPHPLAIYDRLTPKFVPFLCEWRGCRAELQNLDTLARHVTAVHTRRVWTHCCWASCADAARPMASRAELLAHIEEVHMEAFRWHVGDGPRNAVVPALTQKQQDEEGQRVPDYLLDDEGRQVTPSVRDQQVEDRATYLKNRRRLRDLLVLMNEKLPDNDDDEEEEEGEGPEELYG